MSENSLFLIYLERLKKDEKANRCPDGCCHSPEPVCLQLNLHIQEKDINDITAEDIQAAADKMMGVEEETAAPAQTSNDAPTPDDYIVSIEMTSENFGDYFELSVLPVLDDWGEPTGKYTYIYLMQTIGNNIRCTGDPYKSENDEKHCNIFDDNISAGYEQIPPSHS